VSDKTGKAVQHITFDALVVNEFEYKLNLSLEMFSKRIKWLMQSSRRAFGMVQGERIAVLIDSSNSNMGFGRAIDIQDSLLNLANEQLSKKKQFYFLSFGSDVEELWDSSPKDVHHRTYKIKLKEKIKDNKQLLKELGILWNKMPKSEKKLWQEISDIEKENYNKKLKSIFSEENDVKLNLKNDKDDNKIFKKIILRNSKKKLAETCQSKKAKLK